MDPLPGDALLMTLGEVSVAFVGFSMVISVLGAESVRRVNSMRDVAEIGLQAVGASFLPLVIDAYGAPPETTWRLASAMVLAFVASGIALALQRRREPLSQALRSDPARNGAIVALNLGIITVLLFNVLLAGSRAGARYVTAVLFLLAIGGLQFLDATFGSRTDARTR